MDVQDSQVIRRKQAEPFAHPVGIIEIIWQNLIVLTRRSPNGGRGYAYFPQLPCNHATVPVSAASDLKPTPEEVRAALFGHDAHVGYRPT
jgi:hypothetical protein